MAGAPLPDAEWQRLSALRRYDVLDTAPEAVFDELTALAARLGGAPIALLSFVDEKRVWFKSRVGLEVAEAARERSLCAQVIQQHDLFVIADTCRDARTSNASAVIERPGVRFFAGIPVRAATGENIGALCILDPQARHLTAAQEHDLRLVRREIEAHLELRRHSHVLSDQDRLLRTIIECEPECVKLLGRDGFVRMMNRAGLQMIEADSADQVAGHCIYPLIAAEDRAAFQALTDRVFAGGEGSLEFRVTGLKGGRRWLETRAVPLRDDAGTVVALLGITRDVTEQKRAYAALRESEKNYRMLFEQATDGIFVTDPDGRILDANAAASTLLGYSLAELVQRGIADVLAPGDVPQLAREIPSLSSGETLTTEWRGQRKDGTQFIAEVTAKQLPDGRLQAFVRDVTDRAELQAQFLQAQKMESIGRLAGGIAHDFNNLLTVINGMAGVALENLRPDDPLRPGLQEIRLAGDRAARLTRQLLAVSRQQILKPEVLNLSDVVRGMEDMLHRLLGEDIALALSLASDLGSIKADPGQIEQVLLNLAVNARDAMADGGTLTITTADVELDAAFAADHATVVPGPHVMLTVRDSGIGMDEATCKRIFEPFFTTKEPEKGTGLGLSTVYGIVKQSGGTIWVSSEPARGTSFAIYFPRVAATPARKMAPRDDGTAGTETILLVEDERAIRDLAKRILESGGYTVLVASNGDDAVAMARRHRSAIELLLTDVVMPGMNGRELATRISQTCADVKVLYMSGYTDDAILRHGVLDDADGFITKPFTPAELKRKVRDRLDGDPGRARSGSR